MNRPEILRVVLALATMVAVSDCTSFSPRFPTDAGAMQADFGIVVARASYAQLTADYAVTNRHTANLVWGDVIKSQIHDLAFFRHKGAAPEWADAVVGDPVVVNGNPVNWGDWIAADVLDVPPLWPWRQSEAGSVVAIQPSYLESDYNVRGAMAVFVRGGGSSPGFSGGPVVDSKGRVVGVVSGPVELVLLKGQPYRKGDSVVIPSSTVWSEFHRLIKQEVAEK